MKLSKCSAIFFASACFLFQPLAHAQYSFTDLGAPLSGYANSTASGVNNKGEVVGICYNDILLSQAFLWTNGVFSALSLPGHNVTRAGRINDNGDIIGVATITALQDGYYVNAGSTLVHWNRNFPNTQFNPVAWPAGHYKNSFDYAYPSGINQNNQAAGSTILNQSWGDFWSNGNQLVYAGDLDQQVPAFWDNGIMTILAPPDLQPWDLFYGHAHDINDDGTIVGTMSRYSFIDSSRNGSFIFISQSGGPAEPLPGPFFYPFRINNAGDILCLSPEPDYLPSIYRNGTFIPLGTLDAGGGRLNPRSMNNSGQVVGDALNTVTGLYTAFLWQLDPVTGQSTIVDLNEVAAPEGWHLNAGNQITDSGVIVGSGTFEGQERAFMLTPAVIAVDANRDGEITFDGKDGTSPEKPFRFWLNDDIDQINPPNAQDPGEEDDIQQGTGQPNYVSPQITCRRDLEDFTRIHVVAPVGFNPTDTAWEVKFQFADVSDGLPGINLWRAINPSLDYLTSEPVADQLLTRTMLTSVTSSREFIVPNDLFDNPEKKAALLFEGRTSGKGALTVRFYKTGQKIAEGKIFLELKIIADMYEHYTVGDTANMNVNDIQPNAWLATSFSYTDQSPEEQDYILFVHGWRMLPWERRAFAETGYKRLWHQGYKGRYGLYSWPTEWHDGTTTSHRRDPRNYDNSERKAWRSAQGLVGVLASLNNKYPGGVRVFAHSMGNVVVSEALLTTARNGGLPVHTYVASQAAVAAHSYNPSAPVMFNGGVLDNHTPNVYSAYPSTGVEQFAGMAAATGAMVNFINPLDYALESATAVGISVSWRRNQELKPDDHARPGNYVLTYHFDFFRRGDRVRRFYSQNRAGQRRLLTFPADSYEIIAHCAEARSRALGAQPGVAGPFGEEVNLSTQFGLLNFGALSVDHSGQFRSFIARRGVYWRQLLDTFRLDPKLN